MTRIATSGAELRWVGDLAYYPPDGYSTSPTKATIETSIVRSGTASYKCVSSGASECWMSFPLYGITTGLHYYARAWMYFTGYPASTVQILELQYLASANMGGARMTSTGRVHAINQAGTQIGSDSEILALNTWHLFECHGFGSATVNADQVELWVNGTLVGSTTTDNTSSATTLTVLEVGWMNAPGNTSVIYVDDVAVNQSNGTYERGFPPPSGRVLVLKPVRMITRGTWHSSKSSSTTEADIIDALDNTPAIGIADTTASALNNQIRSAGSTGTDAITVECQSYGRAGVPGNVFVDALSGSFLAVGNTTANTRRSERHYLAGTNAYTTVSLRKVGNPTDTFELAIQADSSSNPDGTDLGVMSIAGANLSTTAAWTVPIALDIPYTVGSPYHLVLRRSGAIDAANYYEVQTASTTYNDGGSNTYNGSAWGTLTTATHIAFRAYSAAGNAVLNNVYGLVLHGEAIATGTKTGTLSMTNPTVTTLSFSFGRDGGAAGTFPGNFWYSENTAITTNPTVASMAVAPRLTLTKTDTTTRVALCCGLYAVVEYTDPPAGWALYNKTADGTDWWAKYAPHGMVDYKTDETEVLCAAGDWLIVADAAGTPDRSTLTTITDATLRSAYTPI
jgi:hypothetical protein